MGQCYCVDTDVKYKDKKKFVELGNKFIDDELAKGTGFDALDTIDRQIPDGIWEAILTKRCMKKDTEGCYSSDFDATYSWEGLMVEFFEEVAPSLEDGSEMIIYPDSGSRTLTVQSGTVV